MKLNKDLLELLLICGYGGLCITAKDIIKVVGDSKGNVNLTKSNLKKVKEKLKLISFEELTPRNCAALSENDLSEFFSKLVRGDDSERNSEYLRVVGISEAKNIPQEEDFYWEWEDCQVSELIDKELLETAYEENLKLLKAIKKALKPYSKEQIVKHMINDTIPKPICGL
ncbi:hypothetical protein M0R04_15305 [Candidatus Dojkabacteria bacterium]|jgi:hypothetical protein|nr:hypothetical protein [Candidatus Dojkabacteria bacterium]